MRRTLTLIVIGALVALLLGIVAPTIGMLALLLLGALAIFVWLSTIERAFDSRVRRRIAGIVAVGFVALAAILSASFGLESAGAELFAALALLALSIDPFLGAMEKFKDAAYVARGWVKAITVPHRSMRAMKWFAPSALALGAAAVLIGTLLPDARWPFQLAAPYDPHLLALSNFLDALLGALLLYLALRRSCGRFAASIGALLWIVAGPRVAATWAHPFPSFLLPALLAVWSLFPRGPVRHTSLLALAVLAGLLSPAMAIAVALVAAVMIGSENRSLRGSALVLLGAGLGVFLHLHFLGERGGAMLMVAQHADIALRSVGGDGFWPWEILFPAIDMFGGSTLLPASLLATGHTGNLLLLSSGIGYGLLLFVVLGLRRYPENPANRANPVQRSLLLLVVLGAAIGLPSHAAGIALPTLTHLIEALGGSPWWAATAGKCVIAFALVVLATQSARSVLLAMPALAAVVLVLLAAAVVPNPMLRVPTLGTPLADALNATRSGSQAVVLLLRDPDSWTARYARAIAPGLRVGDLRSKPAACSTLIVDLGGRYDEGWQPFAGLLVQSSYRARTAESAESLPVRMRGDELAHLDWPFAIYRADQDRRCPARR
uniref:Uncharacterized protein n=1 Tax=mine drainage metagenome TaxID=410659 RepID=E6Q518_9ZZZZ